jgi:hypothetical protein
MEDVFIGLAVVVVGSCFLYACSIVRTIYNDHQQLVHAYNSQQNEISELKNRPAEASKNTATQPVATKESSNSLRRRIVRIANETEAFETQRNLDRTGIDMTRDAQGTCENILTPLASRSFAPWRLNAISSQVFA